MSRSSALASPLLRLPQVVLASAQVMFHRFYARRSLARMDPGAIASAALFLASKVEECQKLGIHGVPGVNQSSDGAVLHSLFMLDEELGWGGIDSGL